MLNSISRYCFLFFIYAEIDQLGTDPSNLSMLSLRHSGLPGFVISSGRSGRFAYQMVSHSIAMMSNDLKVIHLRSVNQQMETEYFLDVFAHDGTHKSTLDVTGLLKTANYVTDVLLLNNNTLLVSYVDDLPIVDVYRLEVME